jgi:prephenate dehydrogenase
MAQITILGLDTLGISLGLALRRTAQPPAVVGVDKDGANARRAQQLGAVDRTEGWISSAVKNAALVILNEPFSRQHDVLEAIGASLPQGCVIASTASPIVPLLVWSDQYLPEGISFVAAHPILNPGQSVAEPNADLFKQAQVCIVPSSKANAMAMDLVSSLATAVGAQPFYLDAAEHDGLVTAVEGLAGLVGTLLMSAAAEASSWRDMRRLAGTAFAQATTTAQADPADQQAALRANRENLARWLLIYQTKLEDARAALLAEEDEPLIGLLTHAHQARDQWQRDSRGANWEGVAEMPKVGMGQMLSNLILPHRQPPDQDKKRKR